MIAPVSFRSHVGTVSPSMSESSASYLGAWERGWS